MKLIYKNTSLVVVFIITYIFFGIILKLDISKSISYYEEKTINLENTIKLLQNELNIFKNTEYSFKTSKLLFNNEYNYNTGIINLGKTDNIKKGMYIVNNHNLVGLITNVKNNISYVSFLTKNIEIPVVINNTLGILCGYDLKTDLYLICNINNYENIRVGDTGLTVRDEYNPISYFIGTVTKIKDNNYEKQIYLKSNINIYEIEYVSVFVW